MCIYVYTTTFQILHTDACLQLEFHWRNSGKEKKKGVVPLGKKKQKREKSLCGQLIEIKSKFWGDRREIVTVQHTQ